VIRFREGCNLDSFRPKLSRSDDENSAVDEQSRIKSYGSVNESITTFRTQSFNPAIGDAFYYKSRVKVKIVGHDGGANNSGCNVKRLS